MDALMFLEDVAQWGPFQFDGIHASPPCQFYSNVTPEEYRGFHPDLIGPARALLELAGLPYVIENVECARPWLHDPVMLCGSSFGLDVQRHRLFETNWPLMASACAHGWQTPRFPTQHGKRGTYLARVVHVNGESPTSKGGGLDVWRRAMGIDWMTREELVEAIPPAYTEFIGHQLAQHLASRSA